MKIASWNVNSLKVRLPHVLSWLESQKPHVLALQETKIQDVNFPVTPFAEAGYHVIYAGEKAYNGVALLSKVQAEDIVVQIPNFDDPQRRLLGATIGNIRILNCYVPNGFEVGSDKYHYKLFWLSELKKYIQKEKKKFLHLILLGDFNIAPEDRDVHNPSLLEGSVLVSDLEREKWRELLAEGFIDAFRLFKEEGGHYSWWDYRMNAFKRNLGLRIDHILVSEALAKRCKRCEIDRLPRTFDRPSDHAPIFAEFEE